MRAWLAGRCRTWMTESTSVSATRVTQYVPFFGQTQTATANGLAHLPNNLSRSPPTRSGNTLPVSRARVQARVGEAGVVEAGEAHGDHGALGAYAAGVERLVALVGERGVGEAVGHLAEQVMRGVTSGASVVDGGDGTEQRLHLRVLVSADVAAGDVTHGQRHEAVAAVVEVVVDGVVAKREGGCRCGAAHGAANQSDNSTIFSSTWSNTRETFR